MLDSSEVRNYSQLGSLPWTLRLLLLPSFGSETTEWSGDRPTPAPLPRVCSEDRRSLSRQARVRQEEAGRVADAVSSGQAQEQRPDWKIDDDDMHAKMWMTQAIIEVGQAAPSIHRPQCQPDDRSCFSS